MPKYMRKKNARQVGAEWGKVTGKTTRNVIEIAQLTAKDAGSFTSAFINNFKKELKNKK